MSSKDRPSIETTHPVKPRVLIVTTVGRTAAAFLYPYADYLRGKGWKIGLAASDLESWPTLRHHFDPLIALPWSRSILAVVANLAGFRKMRRVLREGEYDIVHTHTPIAAFITRFACMGLRRAERPKIVYTSHGFHFHRNNGWLRNELFKLLEKLPGRWTDLLIVINREDEQLAHYYRLVREAPVVRLPGIGIDLPRYDSAQFSPAQRDAGRAKLQVPSEVPLALMVAEFNPGKRHRDILQAMVRCRSTSLHIAFAGTGPELERMKALATELGVVSRCRFLGMVDDVPLLCASSQLMVLPSEREGLPRTVMEAMAAGLPVVGADSRGIRDLLEGGCGLLYPVGDVPALAAAVDRLVESPRLAQELSAAAKKKIADYGLGPLLAAQERLYLSVMDARQ